MNPSKLACPLTIESLLAAALLLLTGCQTPQAATESGQRTATPASVLRIGVTPNVPPMIFKRGREFVGVEADLARLLAAELGKAPEFVEVPWEEQIEALRSGRTDIIMSSMSVTPARATRIEFTQPYMRSGQMAVVRRSEAAGLRIGMFSTDYRVGAQKATTGDFFVQQEMPRAKRVTYSNAEAGAKAVRKKRIDVFIHDAPVAWWLASENEAEGLTVIPVLLTEEYLAWGIRKENAELVQATNQFVEKLRQNGQLQNIVRTWIPLWN